MWVEPVVLEGRVVRLEPLAMRHSEGLYRLATPSLLEYSTFEPTVWTEEGFRDYIERTLAMPGRLPLAIVDKASGLPAGTSSYFDIREQHRGLEIGYTWLGTHYQGTKVNPESKYLMLRHAFETLGAVRVQLKTDARNLHSQRAIAKLGAKLEGRLRKHIVLPNGYIRDTVMFSIIDEEWPMVKERLEERLGYVP